MSDTPPHGSCLICGHDRPFKAWHVSGAGVCGECHERATASSGGLPAEERETSDSERLDWVEAQIAQGCAALYGSPPAGLRTEPRWLVHRNGIGYVGGGRTIREAIDAARQSSPHAAGPREEPR